MFVRAAGTGRLAGIGTTTQPLMNKVSASNSDGRCPAPASAAPALARGAPTAQRVVASLRLEYVFISPHLHQRMALQHLRRVEHENEAELELAPIGGRGFTEEVTAVFLLDRKSTR